LPRARRHYLPGYIWHITHRCHKKEFLFKFAKDRRRWKYWLFEAKKRYALINYKKLTELLHSRSIEDFKDTYNGWIEENLRIDRHVRDSKWTQSVAVGSKEFVEMTDIFCWQDAQRISPVPICQLFRPRHIGQIKPSGQRSLLSYSTQAFSVENHSSNSCNVRG